MTTTAIYATGKSKTAVARVWLSAGTGAVSINNKTSEEYFERETSRMIARQSLELLESGRIDVRRIVTHRYKALEDIPRAFGSDDRAGADYVKGVYAPAG